MKPKKFAVMFIAGGTVTFYDLELLKDYRCYIGFSDEKKKHRVSIPMYSVLYTESM